jgi:hypothetical protein
MKRRPWTDAERDLLRAHYADTPTAELAARIGRSVKTVYSVAYKLGLRKSGTYFAAGLGGRAGDGRGAATRFQPGHTTWNKGQRYIAGGRSAETRFKPGRIPHTWKPVGTYRVRQDVNGGYLEQKMTDTGCTRRDWIAVHRMVWEATHGPIPPNHVVAFRPGRKSIVFEEITLDALELVSRQEMIRRNTIHRYPLEIKHNMRLLGRLKSAVAKKESAR